MAMKCNHLSLEAGTLVRVAGGLDEAEHRGGVDVVVLIKEGAPRVPLDPNPDLPVLRRSNVLICDQSLEIINLKLLFGHFCM